jgi:hypothetical protein
MLLLLMHFGWRQSLVLRPQGCSWCHCVLRVFEEGGRHVAVLMWYVPACSTSTTGLLLQMGALTISDTTSVCGWNVAVQVRYPDRITLIRGNHESRQITQVCAAVVQCCSSIDGAVQRCTVRSVMQGIAIAVAAAVQERRCLLVAIV